MTAYRQALLSMPYERAEMLYHRGSISQAEWEAYYKLWYESAPRWGGWTPPGPLLDDAQEIYDELLSLYEDTCQ